MPDIISTVLNMYLSVIKNISRENVIPLVKYCENEPSHITRLKIDSALSEKSWF